MSDYLNQQEVEELFRLLGFYADGGKVTGVDDYIRNRYK